MRVNLEWWVVGVEWERHREEVSQGLLEMILWLSDATNQSKSRPWHPHHWIFWGHESVGLRGQTRTYGWRTETQVRKQK